MSIEIETPPLSDDSSYDLLALLVAKAGFGIREEMDSQLRSISQMSGGNPFNLQMLAGCIASAPLNSLISELQREVSGIEVLEPQGCFNAVCSALGSSAQRLIAALRMLPQGLNSNGVVEVIREPGWQHAVRSCIRCGFARSYDDRLLLDDSIRDFVDFGQFDTIKLVRNIVAHYAKLVMGYDVDDPEYLDKVQQEWGNIRVILHEAKTFQEWHTVALMLEAILPFLWTRSQYPEPEEVNNKPSNLRYAPIKLSEATIQLAGEVDFDTHLRIRDQLDDVLNMCASGSMLYIDLDQVDHMDSSGISTLVVFLKRTRSVGVSLRLICKNPKILRMFEITGLDTAFTILPSPTGVS